MYMLAYDVIVLVTALVVGRQIYRVQRGPSRMDHPYVALSALSALWPLFWAVWLHYRITQPLPSSLRRQRFRRDTFFQ